MEEFLQSDNDSLPASPDEHREGSPPEDPHVRREGASSADPNVRREGAPPTHKVLPDVGVIIDVPDFGAIIEVPDVGAIIDEPGVGALVDVPDVGANLLLNRIRHVSVPGAPNEPRERSPPPVDMNDLEGLSGTDQDDFDFVSGTDQDGIEELSGTDVEKLEGSSCTDLDELSSNTYSSKKSGKGSCSEDSKKSSEGPSRDDFEKYGVRAPTGVFVSSKTLKEMEAYRTAQVNFAGLKTEYRKRRSEMREFIEFCNKIIAPPDGVIDPRGIELSNMEVVSYVESVKKRIISEFFSVQSKVNFCDKAYNELHEIVWCGPHRYLQARTVHVNDLLDTLTSNIDFINERVEDIKRLILAYENRRNRAMEVLG